MLLVGFPAFPGLPDATQCIVLDPVAALGPEITPYGRGIDLNVAPNLGLNAAVIAGARSRATLFCAVPLLLEVSCNKSCLVILPLDELEADRTWRRLTFSITFWFSLLGFGA